MSDSINEQKVTLANNVNMVRWVIRLSTRKREEEVPDAIFEDEAANSNPRPYGCARSTTTPGVPRQDSR
ncbi:hypothetical protein JTE90_023125 [Oedothorax gibbosus]|uniref:Uncharacterized protein n=1 Tax=Oedothorax gibbosus TaxID=931172 RepID=A0AAV6UMG7_9ARAC|nr:hypothetical protein JTE90_023125 [Oedothorax gibbosus]